MATALAMESRPLEFSAKLYLDTEIKAPIQGALKAWGLDRYSRDPRTSFLLFQYAINDEPVCVWDCYHQPRAPSLLTDALRDPSVQLIAHNAQFDRVLMWHKLGFQAPQQRWFCTQSQALTLGLPGDLDKLSKIYCLGDEGKQKERGKELIELFCEQGASPDEHPLDWLEFIDYGVHDVMAMRLLHKHIPMMCFTPFEQRVYALDQKINDRGFGVDLPLAETMIDVSLVSQESLDAQTYKLSGGTIDRATQRERVKEFINSGDTFQITDMRAETLRKALRDEELTPEIKQMIELRLLRARSSIAKCRTALLQAGPPGDDGVTPRIRYAMKYRGGGRIARWSHKGFQPGNMPRPARKRPIIELATSVLEQGPMFMRELWGDEAQSVCSDCLRGLIIAPPGKKLVSADWSNIEGRKLAWYAREEWKLQVYRDKDAGIGEDGYKIVFHNMTGIPIEEIDDFRRQQGKGADLSMGYEGGVGAYVNIANSYQLDLVYLGKVAPTILPPALLERGEQEWEWTIKMEGEDDEETGFDDAEEKQLAKGLPHDIFVACSALKHAWRNAHPRTKALWAELLECAKLAVAQPGKAWQCASGRVLMFCDTKRDWLGVRIPSGRMIMFAKPKLETKVTIDRRGREHVRQTLSALKSPSWTRRPLYGGLFANAITQGGCRDILALNALKAEERGYPLVLHIHDQLIAELDENSPLTHETLCEMMCEPIPGMEGLPLAAEGYTAKRFRK